MIDASFMPAAYARLLVADAERATSFYAALGFAVVHRDPVFVHLRWAQYAELFLVATPAGHGLEGRRGVGVILCFDARHVPLETIAERAEGIGASVDGPRAQPWHTRELMVVDPDGYRLSFVTPD
jgi:catechol 2,3-dioxygenase-like lactoylglutathione lyase family enzyme